MSKIIAFLKKEAVLVIASVLAIISAFFVKPDAMYADYIDFRTLAILFSLMCVMAGLAKLGVFKKVAEEMLKSVKNESGVVLILVLLCFFFSMVITNDVALITFVPFTFTTLSLLGEDAKRRLSIPTVVLQTIAANLGSMLTPIGNPQNLYLYSKNGIDFFEFIKLMLPYTVLSLVLVVLFCFVFTRKSPKEARKEAKDTTPDYEKRLTLTEMFAKSQTKYHSLLILYLLLFVVAVLAVLRVIPFELMFFMTLILVVLSDRRTLLSVDYSLLLTFVAFFVFIGNMGRIPAFSEALSKIIGGREVVTAVVSSQVISNVPAALLLSGFTDDFKALIAGTNIGGLGTLIASMASLISYKLVAAREDVNTGKYFKVFTVMNIVFLIPLMVMSFILVN